MPRIHISTLVFIEDMTIDFPLENEVSEPGQKKRIISIALGLFLFILLLLVVIEWAIDSQSGGSGTFSPKSELVDSNGVIFDLTELEGSPVVVNFFASWCTPCRREMRAIEEISASWKDRVVFIGINSQETDIEEAKKLVKETGVTYTILFGGDGELLEEVGAVGIPFTLFVNPDTSIAGKYLSDLDKDELNQYLEKFFS